MKFEEFLKTTHIFSAEKARQFSIEKSETQKIATFQETVKMPEFCDFIDSIKLAAMDGKTNTSIMPSSTEEIESYTVNHKIVPEEMLKFSDRQHAAFTALKDLGYIVSIGSVKFFTEGMNQACDEPLKGEMACVYWGVN